MAIELIKDWNFAIADHIANVEKWWKDESFEYGVAETNSDISRWFADFTVRYNIAQYREYSETGPFKFVSYAEICEALNLFDPQISRKKGADEIIIYESAKKRLEQKRLSLKPGKAIRRILPTLPDRYLEKAVDEFKLKFDSSKYEIQWAETREQFKEAFQSWNFDSLANIYTNTLRKSLISSCMTQGHNTISGDNYQHLWLGSNPGEAYASGDFKLIKVINTNNGKIAARCIVCVCKTPFTHAPIYGTNETVLDMIQAELDSIGALPAKLRNYDEGNPNANFIGARLLCIRSKDGFLAPYQDCVPGKIDAPKPDDEYMILERYGDITLSALSGTVTVSVIDDRIQCYECGCPLDEDDPQYSHNGDTYCESCYADNFQSCEYCDETFPGDEMHTVYDCDGRGGYNTSQVCRHCRNSNYTRLDAGAYRGKYWLDAETIETGCGHTICELDTDCGDWFYSDESEEYWSIHELAETTDGRTITQSEARDLGLSLLDCGQWGEPTAQAIAAGLIDATLANERQSAMQARLDGQYELPFYQLPRACDATLDELPDFELPTLGGLVYWPAVEKLALSTNSAISRSEDANGNPVFVFETGRNVSYAGNSTFWRDETFQYANLAECLAAFETLINSSR